MLRDQMFRGLIFVPVWQKYDSYDSVNKVMIIGDVHTIFNLAYNST